MLDRTRSYAIGDSPQDVEAAHRFGGIGCLVRTGWAADDRVVKEAEASAAFVGDSIVDAADWIITRATKRIRDGQPYGYREPAATSSIGRSLEEMKAR